MWRRPQCPFRRRRDLRPSPLHCPQRHARDFLHFLLGGPHAGRLQLRLGGAYRGQIVALLRRPVLWPVFLPGLRHAALLLRQRERRPARRMDEGLQQVHQFSEAVEVRGHHADGQPRAERVLRHHVIEPPVKIGAEGGEGGGQQAMVVAIHLLRLRPASGSEVHRVPKMKDQVRVVQAARILMPNYHHRKRPPGGADCRHQRAHAGPRPAKGDDMHGAHDRVELDHGAVQRQDLRAMLNKPPSAFAGPHVLPGPLGGEQHGSVLVGGEAGIGDGAGDPIRVAGDRSARVPVAVPQPIPDRALRVRALPCRSERPTLPLREVLTRLPRRRAVRIRQQGRGEAGRVRGQAGMPALKAFLGRPPIVPEPIAPARISFPVVRLLHAGPVLRRPVGSVSPCQFPARAGIREKVKGDHGPSPSAPPMAWVGSGTPARCAARGQEGEPSGTVPGPLPAR